MSIGQRLKAARKNRGVSQDMLAEKIGASRGVITNIEHDKVNEPQSIVINAICNALNINKEWLIEGIGPMDIEPSVIRSTNILSEIYSYAQDLSEEEQLYVLDMIKTYKKHFKD